MKLPSAGWVCKKDSRGVLGWVVHTWNGMEWEVYIDEGDIYYTMNTEYHLLTLHKSSLRRRLHGFKPRLEKKYFIKGFVLRFLYVPPIELAPGHV